MGVVHKVKRAAAAFESQMAASSSSSSSSTPSPVASPASISVSKYPRFGKRGAPQAFPSKLYEILEGENPDIVGWTSTGRGFEVRDHARLSSEVLGRFFKQDKFSSFQRQLNLYGFRKITKGSEAGSYQHPHFRRGERTTLLTIRRSTKASPARLVPSSPASHPPPPATPYNSVAAERPRSATPSPPPAPVSRGVLPWPRGPAAQSQSAPLVRQDVAARGVSPDRTRGICGGGGGGGGGGVGPAQGTSGGRVSGGETPVDRLGDRRQQQHLHGGGGGGGGAWPAEAGGGGGWGYAQHVGSHAGGGSSAGGGVGSGTSCGEEGWANANPNHAQNGGGSRSGNGWKKEETMEEEEEDVRANNSAQVVTGSSRGTAAAAAVSAYGGQGSQWEEEVSKKEQEQGAQGLDHQDVEVVGLLQRMAKEAQDSPSRKQQQAAAPPARLEGGHAQETAAATAAISSSNGHPHFRMPKPSPTGPEEAPGQGQQPHGQKSQCLKSEGQQQSQGQQQQGQQVVLAERLYDILSHGHAGKTPPGYLPFGFNAEGRTASLSHPHQHHHLPSLPSPFPPAVTPSDGGSRGSRGDSFDTVNGVHRTGGGGGGGGGDMSEYDRRALLAGRSRSRSAERGDGGAAYNIQGHQHQHQQRQQDGVKLEPGSSSGRSAFGGGGGGGGRGGGRGYPYEGRFGSGPIQNNGSPLPRFNNFDRHVNGQEHGGAGDDDANDRRSSGPVAVPRFHHRPAWQGPEGSYATAATGPTLGKYQGEKGGHVVGDRPVGRTEAAAWRPHRPFELAGRRVVN